MFCNKYVPLVERERIDQEYLSLRQATQLMTVITKMFTKRALFCPEYPASDQVKMSPYLSMLKM